MISLEILKQDKRLARVFHEDDANLCCLQLWILDLLKEKTQEFQLLYGWIIPATRSRKGWFVKDGGKRKNVPSDSSEYRIAKLTLIESGNNLHLLIQELLQCTELEKTCSNIEIDLPPENYAQFQLIEDNLKKYAVRPVVFQPSKESVSDFIFKHNAKNIYV